MKKIIFLSTYDSKNKASWSGTPYSMQDAFKRNGYCVEFVGPISSYAKIMIRAVSFFMKLIFGYRLDSSHSILSSIEIGLKATWLISRKDCDYIVAPAGASTIAFLYTKKPILYLSDTTFGQFCNYYKSSNHDLVKISKIAGNYLESRALKKSSIVSFPSSWAADFAKKYYGVKNNIQVINWGPNLSVTPSYREKALPDAKCEFIEVLFLGVDWYRKGGDIVFKTVEKLVEAGFKAKLHVCGCTPILEHGHVKPEWLVEHGKLNKNNEGECKSLYFILNKSHLMFVPSRAECYGMVFCEAAAYGLPVISTKTGGITSIVEHGVTGYLLDIESSAEEYFKYISNILLDSDLFVQMSMHARRKYEEKLNWDVWCKKITRVIEGGG